MKKNASEAISELKQGSNLMEQRKKKDSSEIFILFGVFWICWSLLKSDAVIRENPHYF